MTRLTRFRYEDIKEFNKCQKMCGQRIGTTESVRKYLLLLSGNHGNEWNPMKWYSLSTVNVMKESLMSIYSLFLDILDLTTFMETTLH